MKLVRALYDRRSHRSIIFRLEECWTKLGELKPLHEHVNAVIEWLLRAQQATPDDGVSECYHVQTGTWYPSYPETTGYIICSLLRAADAGFDKENRLTEATRRMGIWLASVQLANGAFTSGNVANPDKKPTVFNTGQILKGLTDLSRRGLDNNGDLSQSARCAADWLIKYQDDDGCWRRGISNLTSAPVHSYNVRTAWALARYGIQCDYPEAVAAALRNGKWVCSIQDPDTDWIPHMNFDNGVSPFTHTIAYTINGLFELGVLCRNKTFIEHARRAAVRMFNLQDETTGALPGQCMTGWQPVKGWTSLTGNAQMAIIGFRLAQITNDHSWFVKGRNALALCRRLQEFGHANPGRRGGLRGSYPGSIGYGSYCYMNWTQKFYLDALLAQQGFEVV